MRRFVAVLPIALASLLWACERPAAGPPEPSPAALDPDSFIQWKLPRALKEISGLAVTADGRLFAHDDERAVIHQLDYANGKIIKSFAFGEQPLRGDFEGIAVFDDRFALSTSGGELYLGPEGEPGQRVAFARYDTGLGDACEFEGLAFDPAARTLLLPCKTLRSGSKKVGLKIIAWSIDRESRQADRDIVLSTKELRQIAGKDDYRPSGIDIDPRTGHRIVISARQPLMLEISAGGELLAAHALPSKSRHEQTEGIALSVAGELFLADEGRNRRARLAVYRWNP